MNEQDEILMRTFIETLSTDKLNYLLEILIEEINARKAKDV